MAGRWHPSKCRVCGKLATPDDPISATGLCLRDGLDRLNANNTQLHAHSGPFFDHWRRRSLAAFGVVLLDDSRESA